MRRRRFPALALALALALPPLLVAPPRGAGAAESCAQMNDRLYGSSGQGGDAARFRLLEAKAEQEAVDGDNAAADRDRAAAGKLAASILASAKAMKAAGCPTHPAAIAAAASPSGATVTMRSPHGCVGFDGTWGITNASDNLVIKNGVGTQKSTTYSGRVSGNVMRGRWSDPQTGHGTFVLTLSGDGDWIDAILRNDTGASGTWRTTCVGP